MSVKASRRKFLQGAAYSGIAVCVGDRAWARGQGPNEKVNFACIGVGGKGDSDSGDAGRLGNVVAICDVDDGTLAKAQQRFPGAKPYNDYRKMLDEMGKSIDAVTVSTPDHHHALAAAHAMHMGKHAFVQKPLTHSIYEARKLAELAKKMKVATQMGNQGTAGSSLRLNAARIKAGHLGVPKEVHVWTNRPIWPQGGPRPASAEPPSTLHWDLWLGPAPERPFAPGAYHTFAWRGWWDFGTGALGDMACHTVNLPFMALDLRNPISVVAEVSDNNHDSYPKASKITYMFPANGKRPAIKMVWYDGGNLPPAALFKGGKFADLISAENFPSSGSLIIGDKDSIYSPNDYGEKSFWIHSDPPEVDFPQSPGHFEEYIRAIKGGVPAMSNFPDYASPLTETILLGNLAVWGAGQRVDWDPVNLRVKNGGDPSLARIVKPMYRGSYTL